MSGLSLEQSADRERALSVDCPHCPAGVGEPCRRPDGGELERFPAHSPRLAAAGVVHAPIDTRELRRG